MCFLNNPIDKSLSELKIGQFYHFCPHELKQYVFSNNKCSRAICYNYSKQIKEDLKNILGIGGKSTNNIALQPSPIYGPVKSRRLGWSLGINICPAKYKLCSFNCVYCQYGWTNVCRLDVSDRLADLTSTENLYDSLEKLLLASRQIDNFTFSGNGESTLHPYFDDMVDIVLSLKARYVPDARVGILSNSSKLSNPSVYSALSKLDFRIMKLDAGDSDTFNRINMPCPDVRYDDILDGLKSLDNIIIQTMFVDGEPSNTGERQVYRWMERISEIGPKSVQIYSLHRPPAASSLIEADSHKLAGIAERTRAETGIPVDYVVASKPYEDRVHQPWMFNGSKK